jgi:hypothetical protein
VPIGLAFPIAILAVIVLGFDFGLRRVLTYTVGEEGISLFLFRRVRWWHLKFEDVGTIEVAGHLELLMDHSLRWLRTENRSNRVLGRQRVVITSRNGRVVILSPAEPSLFARAVADKLAETRSPTR